MSWFYDFHAVNTRSAIKHIELNCQKNDHFPEQAMRSVVASLNALKDVEGQIIHVRSQGSINYHPGSAGVIGRHELLVEQVLSISAPERLTYQTVAVIPDDDRADLFDDASAAGQYNLDRAKDAA